MADNTNNANEAGYEGVENQDVIEDAVLVAEEAPQTLVDLARESKLYASHPECRIDTERVIMALAEKAADGVDPNHTSSSYLSKYERTAVLSFRAAQLQKGFPPFIDVPSHVSDVYEIAKLELAQRKMPFIVKRVMPDGRAEYKRIKDLLFSFTD